MFSEEFGIQIQPSNHVLDSTDIELDNVPRTYENAANSTEYTSTIVQHK